MIRQALVLAAGRGGRLVPDGLGPPKPLVPVAGVPILSHVLARVEAAGLEEAFIVLGYRAAEIERYYERASFRSLRLHWLRGADPDRSNGMSVLQARTSLSRPFLLLMGDHLVDAAVLRRLAEVDLEPEGATLCIDRRLGRIYDVEEATKVKLTGERLTAIGKDLADYDAVDTGVFACSPAIFAALEASMRNGDCSLSDGIRVLAQRRVMRSLEIGEAEWADIDTPEALRRAETLIEAGKLALPIEA